MNTYNQILETIKSNSFNGQEITNDLEIQELEKFASLTKISIEPVPFGAKFISSKGSQSAILTEITKDKGSSTLFISIENETDKTNEAIEKVQESKKFADYSKPVYFLLDNPSDEIEESNKAILEQMYKYQQINDHLGTLNVGTYTSEQANIKVVPKRFESFNMQVDSFIDGLSTFNYFKRGWYKKFRPDLDVDVFFQRGLVWTLEQKQSLINSMLNSLPIGQLFINKTDLDNPFFDEIDGVLFDGKQRLTTISEFMNGQFPIIIDGQEIYMNGLPFQSQLKLRTSSILVNETNFDNINDLIDFYVLINTGQSLHSQKEIEKALNFKK